MAEEILIRGLLYGALRRRFGLWAIPLTSLVFAGYHLDPPQFLAIFLMGLLLGWAREISGTIWLPFVIHAANNGLFYWRIFATKP